MYIEESLPIDVYQTLASHHYRHMINTNKKEENFTTQQDTWAIYEIKVQSSFLENKTLENLLSSTYVINSIKTPIEKNENKK